MDDTLEQIIIRENLQTDKWKGFGTGHTYIDFYDRFFRKFRYDNLNILEIGIWKGYSLLLWREYFPNAIIHGIDIIPARCDHLRDERKYPDRIINHCGDSTNKEFIDKEFKGIEFDLIIDDGSHQVQTQLNTHKVLYPYVRKDGYYIVEDVQNLDFDLSEFKKLGECNVVDRRMFKGIPDDVLLIYRKK